MAVTWSWNRKQGELKYDGYTLDLYSGNCLLVALLREKQKPDGSWTYFMPPYFFDDDTHAKRCLGLAKGFDDMFEGLDIHLTLYRDMWDKPHLKKVVGLFALRTGKLTVEIIDTAPEST